MDEIEKTLIRLGIFGALIGLAKLLVGDEKITFRLLLGRILLGVALAVSSGTVLIQFENLSELALIGLACTLGISGQTGIEWLLKRGKSKSETE
ncbi:hypothetical protein [Pragia fontium]|uniref:Phage holin family 2 n=1 Tax=Pragia fontium DSM 5563 = ATCC 49100 TaxID=1122977 RepID=A0AAJ5BGN1_9GAMM|nr:hypothetical protein [Pragia fontium]SFC49767.1 Phage holin family 2 [Pragia fontium DSM 5563 = ATCC 49100]